MMISSQLSRTQRDLLVLIHQNKIQLLTFMISKMKENTVFIQKLYIWELLMKMGILLVALKEK